MLSCKDVTTTIASDALASAPLRRRLAMRLHLMMCEHCRRFARELAVIGTTARRQRTDGDIAARAQRIADRLRAGPSRPDDRRDDEAPDGA